MKDLGVESRQTQICLKEMPRDSVCEKVAGSCKNGNEHLAFIRRKEILTFGKRNGLSTRNQLPGDDSSSEFDIPSLQL